MGHEFYQEAKRVKDLADTNEILKIGLDTEQKLLDLPTQLDQEGIKSKDYYPIWKSRDGRDLQCCQGIV